jgi:hypothetical protein
VLGAVALVPALAISGPWSYANLVAGSEPAPLTFEAAQGAPTGEVTGTWNVAAGSQAGYRVREVLGGQDSKAVGRTPEVTGAATLDGSQVTAGEVAVSVATIASGQSRRDGRFAGDIMDTAAFPTATFRVTEPLDLGSAFTSGAAQLRRRDRAVHHARRHSERELPGDRGAQRHRDRRLRDDPGHPRQPRHRDPEHRPTSSRFSRGNCGVPAEVDRGLRLDGWTWTTRSV